MVVVIFILFLFFFSFVALFEFTPTMQQLFKTSARFASSRATKEFFAANGFAVIENAVEKTAIDRLRHRASQLIDEWQPTQSELAVFQTAKKQTETTEQYFLESGDKIRFFLEKDAVDEHRKLLRPKAESINKIGHALHDLDPVFREFSYSPRMKALADISGIEKPLLLQSMYIFKQPLVGGDVTPHQDNTFIYTEPNSCVGIWVALETATKENGCMWGIPASHDQQIETRFIRDPSSPNTRAVFDPPEFRDPEQRWPESLFEPLEVEAGSVILLHGNFVHRSYPNLSTKSRHAYTLHLISADSHYSESNWLQRSPSLPLRTFEAQDA